MTAHRTPTSNHSRCALSKLAHHSSALTQVAEKQVKWLEKVLAAENERDRKHCDRIELPE
jgi:hypothetical protein